VTVFLFFLFGGLTLAGALGVVLSRNPVHSALFLVLTLLSVAVLFLLQDAQLVAAVQVIVYAGAIVVLFLFVIMLLGVDRSDSLRERLPAQRPLAALLAVGFVLEVTFAVRAGIGLGTKAPGGFDLVNSPGNVQALAKVLFRDYLFPFEVTSVLLLIAAISAMVLAQRKARAVTQAEIEASRPKPEPESVPRTELVP
jgi:NADH-quinone oxidoreductase subunit J